MKRIEIQLKAEERRRLEILSTSGVCQVRELQRAQVLLALDRGILDVQLTAVLGIDRTRIWQIRQRYLSGGLARSAIGSVSSGPPARV
jgi:hypothetical protein